MIFFSLCSLRGGLSAGIGFSVWYDSWCGVDFGGGGGTLSIGLVAPAPRRTAVPDIYISCLGMLDTHVCAPVNVDWVVGLCMS